jgi:hypothetical protein
MDGLDEVGVHSICITRHELQGWSDYAAILEVWIHLLIYHRIHRLHLVDGHL